VVVDRLSQAAPVRDHISIHSANRRTL